VVQFSRLKQRLLAAVLGFVSGHDFSRAVKKGTDRASALLWRILPEMLAKKFWAARKLASLKGTAFRPYITAV